VWCLDALNNRGEAVTPRRGRGRKEEGQENEIFEPPRHRYLLTKNLLLVVDSIIVIIIITITTTIINTHHHHRF
jgi:hypothetical protein